MIERTAYSESWEIYKAHSENFRDDFDYYLCFCKNATTLELFSGYGRLTNMLFSNGVDIESVEIEPMFSKFITMPDKRKNICDVLEFNPQKTYQRIIAGYNSFCLLTDDRKISIFFDKLHSWLTDDGVASLSYFHPDYWSLSEEQFFEYHGKKILYKPSYDLSHIKDGFGIWIDEYFKENSTTSFCRFEYPVRVYKTNEKLVLFLERSRLELVETIKDYKNEKISELGWIDFIVKKRKNNDAN